MCYSHCLGIKLYVNYHQNQKVQDSEISSVQVIIFKFTEPQLALQGLVKSKDFFFFLNIKKQMLSKGTAKA